MVQLYFVTEYVEWRKCDFKVFGYCGHKLDAVPAGLTRVIRAIAKIYHGEYI